jgi:hypothetical protein
VRKTGNRQFPAGNHREITRFSAKNAESGNSLQIFSKFSKKTVTNRRFTDI